MPRGTTCFTYASRHKLERYEFIPPHDNGRSRRTLCSPCSRMRSSRTMSAKTSAPFPPPGVLFTVSYRLLFFSQLLCYKYSIASYLQLSDGFVNTKKLFFYSLKIRAGDSPRACSFPGMARSKRRHETNVGGKRTPERDRRDLSPPFSIKRKTRPYIKLRKKNTAITPPCFWRASLHNLKSSLLRNSIIW